MKKSEVEKFYEWLQKCNNIYLHDNARMVRAFHIIANN